MPEDLERRRVRELSRNRMKRGLAFLDERKPGWDDRVDLDRFNVISATACPLYFAYKNEYPDRENFLLEVLTGVLHIRSAKEMYERCLYYGFDSCVDTDLTGEIMNGVWRRELEKRRSTG